MKLVELLALELAEWPGNGCVQITQDRDGRVFYWRVPGAVFARGEWEHPTGGLCDRLWYLDNEVDAADDHATAIVTRAQWEAEKMKQAKPDEQEGKWIRHRGGKCPVEAGKLIDVRRRDGQIELGLVCGEVGNYTTDDHNSFWRHEGDSSEIMAYRLHKPEQQEESVPDIYADDASPGIEPVNVEHAEPKEQYKAADYPGLFIVTDDPRSMRDRIRTIDTTVESLEEERASLVQRLEGEGFKLVRVDAKVLPKEPDADMSDWRNWKRGDRVRCVSHKHEWSDKAAVGKEYVLSEDPLEDGDSGLHIYVAGFYMNPEDFILVSL